MGEVYLGEKKKKKKKKKRSNNVVVGLYPKTHPTCKDQGILQTSDAYVKLSLANFI